MYRHLKNINELIFYAALSCVAAFVGRQLPGLLVPIMLVRLGVFFYCLWLLAIAEDNKVVAGLIGSATLIGLAGGYWDYLHVWIKFDYERLTRALLIVLFGMLALAGIVIQVYINGKNNSKR